MSDCTQKIYHYLTHPNVTGTLLLGGAILGIFFASSPLENLYHHFITSIPFPSFSLSYGEWISQALMTVFFTSLALEMRYDLSPHGTLNHWRKATLPLVGAIGGMLVPAFIAILCGLLIPHSPGIKGWAVPTATDAAFTVPILAIIPNIPKSLRSFLMALAIFDDLGAMIVLALFYGHSPDFTWLFLSLFLTAGLIILGRKIRTVQQLLFMLPLTFFLWIGLFKTGIEPTLAGVIFGFCLPIKVGQRFHKILSVPVGLFILPLFAFISTGINIRLFSPSFLLSAPLLGACLGLWLGKPLGIWGSIWLANRCKLFTPIPPLQGFTLVGIGMICGIGFTISLLVASLAYPDSISLMQGRCGILIGSTLSASGGWLLLRTLYRTTKLPIKTNF